MLSSAVKMVSWGARLLYAGPAIDLSWHANGVGEFSIALDGDLEVQPDGGAPFTTRSVFVPAGARHLMTFRSARIACLYVDVAAADGAQLLRAMTDRGQGYGSDHRLSSGIEAMAADLLAGRIDPGRRKQVAAEAFGLDPLTTVDPQIALALRFLHETPDEAHGVASLSARVGLPESRFRKAFRAATGVPLKRYRVWVRLSAAMSAARSGASLTEAAHASGFSSSAHFSLAYRNMFGMTPSAFLNVLAGAPRADAGTGGDREEPNRPGS